MTASSPLEATDQCQHGEVVCINPYEFIRKYLCAACGAVMMCDCDRDFGRRFLSHQLAYGSHLETRERIPVTAGFVSEVCDECRGRPLTAYPMAEIHGRTTKLRRYYWREIYFETTRRFAAWMEAGAAEGSHAKTAQVAKREEIEKQVVADIGRQHAVRPKYTYSTVSAASVLVTNRIDVVELTAKYERLPDGTRRLTSDLGIFDSPEALVREHFTRQGYDSFHCESRPFHVLFGIFTWLVVQDPSDPNRQLIGFGSRSAFDAGEQTDPIWTFLPRDFGTRGYGARRGSALRDHFDLIGDEPAELFDYWLESSEELREYLWAHRAEDVAKARRLCTILPPVVLKTILRYLFDWYWHRYTGWPDLLICRPSDFAFVEVKGSRDGFREDQLRWIEANATTLGLPFTVAKVGRAR